MEGNVRIVKELVIVCKNRYESKPATLHPLAPVTNRLPGLLPPRLCRWPVGKNEWKERTKRIHKPVPLKTLGV
jgi:hypothetical protein